MNSQTGSKRPELARVVSARDRRSPNDLDCPASCAPGARASGMVSPQVWPRFASGLFRVPDVPLAFLAGLLRRHYSNGLRSNQPNPAKLVFPDPGEP
jgi:hypothetical protein